MKKLIAGALAALLPLAAGAAYPERPIKLIVPWAAGGDTDNIFRPFAPLLQKQLGATLASTSHFFPALIEQATGVKFKYVSYEGLAPRMNAILGGHVDLTDSNLTQKGKVDAGQLKFLAIATEKRHPEMPNVPTLKELGVNVVYDVNRGIMVPKGAPAGVIAKLESSCAAAANEPAFAQAMKLQGTDVRYLGRPEYAKWLKQNDDLNRNLAKELGLLKR